MKCKLLKVSSLWFVNDLPSLPPEQMYTKVQLQERLIELIHDKYRIISKVEDENAPFKKIYETQKKVCLLLCMG